jgi:hypothetical protein
VRVKEGNGSSIWRTRGERAKEDEEETLVLLFLMAITKVRSLISPSSLALYACHQSR